MSEQRRARLHYHRLPDDYSKEDKLDFLANYKLGDVTWRKLKPNAKNTWLRSDTEDEFERFMPIGSKEGKKASAVNPENVFKTYCSGAVTRRDM